MVKHPDHELDFLSPNSGSATVNKGKKICV